MHRLNRVYNVRKCAISPDIDCSGVVRPESPNPVGTGHTMLSIVLAEECAITFRLNHVTPPVDVDERGRMTPARRQLRVADSAV